MKFPIINFSMQILLLLLLNGETSSRISWRFLSLDNSVEYTGSNNSHTNKNDNYHNTKTVPIVTTLQPKQISVKDLGAIGNGIADDTEAIQATIDRIFKIGGGIVFLPKGTYLVKINSSKDLALNIRSKVIIQGEDRENTVIKLADKQGNYKSILGGTYKSDLSDFSIYDLTIDGNSPQNPVFQLSDLGESKFRYAIRIFSGRRINIERCRFINQNNVNTITVNGEELVSDIMIRNNIFESIGGGKIDYDHSTIYSHGKRVKILNNSFYNSRQGTGTYGARTAIEIHGDEHIVKNNVIEGFIYGINITGYAKSSNNQIISDNLIKNVHTGIVIWSYFDFGNKTKPGLSNCTIINNKIILNVNDWRELWGEYSNRGIALEPNSDAPIYNLNIISNQITFTNFYGTGRRIDNLANGITLWRNAAPKIEIARLRIIGNTIENSLAAGIYISTPIKSGDISENLIINSGQVKNYFHEDYRVAIILDGIFENVNINKNLLRDNQIHNTMTGGIYWFGNCIANCQAKENILQIKSPIKLDVFKTKSSNRVNSFDVYP